MKKLKTALLGLNEAGIDILEALSQMESYDLVAIADSDSELVEKTAGIYDCAGYDDYRLFITENQIDSLIVAAGIHRCYEYIKLAMNKGFNILKLPPPARSFEEAHELVKLARRNNINFVIANTARVRRSFQTFAEVLQTKGPEKCNLISANCYCARKEHPPWQSDPELAGGGAILYDTYQIIDRLVENFGIPLQVFSLSTSLAGDRQQRLYTTEDLAVITMKYSDTLFCSLTASRTLGPAKQFLRVCTGENTMTADLDNFVITDPSGSEIEKRTFEQSHRDIINIVLEKFAASILDPENNPLDTDAQQDLKNMALIQAAYLSARTSMPEQPQQIQRLG